MDSLASGELHLEAFSVITPGRRAEKPFLTPGVATHQSGVPPLQVGAHSGSLSVNGLGMDYARWLMSQ